MLKEHGATVLTKHTGKAMASTVGKATLLTEHIGKATIRINR